MASGKVRHPSRDLQRVVNDSRTEYRVDRFTQGQLLVHDAAPMAPKIVVACFRFASQKLEVLSTVTAKGSADVMDENFMPARAVPPGRILRRELEARGWTQKDLAEILGRPAQAITEIVRGTKQIMPDTAVALAAAFGTSPEFWSNLEANYRFALDRQHSSIRRRDPQGLH